MKGHCRHFCVALVFLQIPTADNKKKITRSRRQAGRRMPQSGHARKYARTDGRTTRKHNVSGPIYRTGGSTKDYINRNQRNTIRNIIRNSSRTKLHHGVKVWSTSSGGKRLTVLLDSVWLFLYLSLALQCVQTKFFNIRVRITGCAVAPALC